MARIREALHIALAHFEVSHQVMRKAHRLRHLQMREAGHDGVRVVLCQIEQRCLQAFEQFADVVNGAAQI